jgi:hypothetical protein
MIKFVDPFTIAASNAQIVIIVFLQVSDHGDGSTGSRFTKPNVLFLLQLKQFR